MQQGWLVNRNSDSDILLLVITIASEEEAEQRIALITGVLILASGKESERGRERQTDRRGRE